MKKYAQILLAAAMASQAGFANARVTGTLGPSEPSWQERQDAALKDVSDFFSSLPDKADAMISAETKLKGDIALRKMILFSLEQGEVLVAATGLDGGNPKQVVTAYVGGALAVGGVFLLSKVGMNIKRLFIGKIMRGTSVVAVAAVGMAATLDLASGIMVIHLGSDEVGKKKEELKAEIVKMEGVLAKASGEQQN
jgi:hypothetical protein